MNYSWYLSYESAQDRQTTTGDEPWKSGELASLRGLMVGTISYRNFFSTDCQCKYDKLLPFIIWNNTNEQILKK